MSVTMMYGDWQSMNETMNQTAVQVVETCGVDVTSTDALQSRDSLKQLQVRHELFELLQSLALQNLFVHIAPVISSIDS